MERRRITFSGRVQGVGFRATARSIASRFPITGWVRNEADGSVLLEAQGTAPDLDQFLGVLRDRMGRLIASENNQPIPVDEAETEFQVRH